MKFFSLLRLLPVFALLVPVLLRAADSGAVMAVRAADDERVAASIAADPARLGAVLSEDLHYAHSNGAIDTKATYLESLVSRRSVYRSFDYVRRDFMEVGPGVVLMHGRAKIEAGTATQQNLLDLNFLAVWRNEGGKWRFIAWQSSRLPPPAPPAPPAPAAPAPPPPK
jgi:hypothetical protein